MSSIVLVDAKNQVYRNHYAPGLNLLATADGHPTGAVFGCLSYSLLGISKKIPDASFIWCWDGMGDTWRHKMMEELPQFNLNIPDDEELSENASIEEIARQFQFDLANNARNLIMGESKQRKKKKVYGYKANRGKPISAAAGKFPTDNKQRALVQIPIIKLILSNLGIRQFEVQNLEGDDLIGVLARKILHIDDEVEVYILSGDRDFYQLLKYDRVRIIKSNKDTKFVEEKDVIKEFGISARDWTKYRAWTGDSTDNIPHIVKVGPVRAKAMLAAGLDPSISDTDKLPEEAKEQFAKYFEPHGIQKVWESVHRNYLLTTLVTKPSNKLLNPTVAKELQTITDSIVSLKSIRRNKESKNPEIYRKLLYLLGKYELNSLIASRDELWDIP